jgi:nucleoside-diphosphate-sugar epimerase
MATGGPILVTGAGGFIGRDLVARLVERGLEVRAMLRPGSRSPFDPHDGVEVARADMRDGNALDSAVRGCRAVIHLAAAKSDERDSEAINVDGARLLVQACERASCRRLVNVSTQSTKIARQGIYARTKLAADRIFMASTLEVTTLLPSVVYGEAQEGVFGTVLRFVRKAPWVLVLGDGRWASAPVYVGDVSQAVMSCLDSRSTIGRAYDIGGPDSISFDELIDRLGAAVGRRPRKLHLPFSLALAIARVVARLPRAPITVSNVLGSNQDTHIDIAPARRDFGFDPIGLATGLEKVVSRPTQEQVTRVDTLSTSGDDPQWEHDCKLICRYLVNCDATADLIGRYQNAMRLKFSATELQDAEWRWLRGHPRALPLLDAAAGLLQPASALRRRVYLMMAILEAVPAHADRFLPRARSTPVLLAEVAWNTLCALANVVLGTPLLLWVRRSR